MPRVIFQEFRDQYEKTRYPFMDTATLTDVTGTLVIPENIFLDAGFCFPEGMPYLSGIQVQNNRIVLTVTSGSDSASCELDRTAIPDVLHFQNDRKRRMGCLVSEKVRLNWLASIETGEYTFYPEAASFAARCNTPSRVIGASSLGTGQDSMHGDVWLVGADGIYLRHMGNNVIRIDMMGEVLHKRANCAGELEPQVCLKSINHVHSDAYGHLVFGMRPGTAAGTRVQVNTTESGLEIKRV